MENLRVLLQENLNIDFVSAILSSPREKDGIMKVKVRPLLKKDTLFFQLEIFLGNQVFHKNLTMNEAVEEILSLTKGMKQFQMETKQYSCTALLSRKGYN